MTATMTCPTPAAFRRKAEAMFRAANPDAPDVSIEWTRTSRPFRLPAGGTGRTGAFRATAEGHRPRLVLASWTAGAWAVR